MARRLLKDTCPLAGAILEGEHDDDLQHIISAAQHRQKSLWTKNTRVRVTGTGNPKTEGAEGVILKVNPKTITVGLGEITYADWDERKQCPVYAGGEWNMTPNFLERI